MYGAYLKAAREKAGLSPVEAAARVGYRSADMIYKLERDAANASLEQLDLLAAAYGVLPGDLLPNSGGDGLDEVFRPIRDAAVGLDDEEIRDLMLTLASMARLHRNAVLRRKSADGNIRPSVNIAAKHNVAEEAAPSLAAGVDIGTEEASESLNARRHQHTTAQSARRKAK